MRNDFASRKRPATRARAGPSGGGLNVCVAPAWSVFGEYNYMDFGTERHLVFADNFNGWPRTIACGHRRRDAKALFGVNYKLSWGGPVVARY